MSPAKASEAFDDPLETDRKNARLVELRSTGGQTVFPPSVHESGELVAWDRFDQPAELAVADARRAAARVASAALLVRHWPGPGSGKRQDTFLALAGGLLRLGWPEDDVSRFLEAVAEATHDEEARKRIDTVGRTAGKQADGKTTTGWPSLATLLGDRGDVIVSAVRAWLGTAPTPRPASPTPEPPEWPNPPDDAAFYGLPGEIARALEPASEADPVALLAQIVLYFGNIVGRNSYFTVEADRHYPNEFAVLVGQSGKGRKGTSRSQIHRVFATAECLRPGYQEPDPALGGPGPWSSDRVQTGLSSGEGAIWAVRDPVEKQERVKDRGQPPRYETVVADPGEPDKRLLVFEPEFHNVLAQTVRQGNVLSAILRQAWETGDLRTLTKSNPARATGAHVSIIGHITAEELTRNLSATESANGFANRFLWFAVRRSNLLPEGGQPDPARIAPLEARLASAIEFATTPREMSRDAEARELWAGIYADLSRGRPGLAGALTGRAEAHVMRLALIYALMDQAPVIRAEHLLAGVALMGLRRTVGRVRVRRQPGRLVGR